MLCDKLKDSRKTKGIMQKTLAEMLNVKPSTVSMWESGKRTPDILTLKRISDALDVPFADLLGDKFVDENFDESIGAEKLMEIRKKAPEIFRSDLETIFSKMDDETIDEILNYAIYLLSKKGIQVSLEDLSKE